MDYEKKYNEALGWMREMYPCLTDSLREDAEHYFPELKESEDERVRKELIEHIKHEAWVSDEQLEQKHRFIAYLEKQKEQKPAEWSEEDERLKQYAIHGLEKYIKEHPDPEFGNATPCEKAAVRWLKSLRPQHHKWYIKKGHWYVCIVDKPEYGWTKGKVYQSPEDNRIETDYRGDLTNWPDSEPWFRPATREEIPDSQPHWKPSEIQLCMLSAVINEPNNAAAESAHIALESLYNDLKKL